MQAIGVRKDWFTNRVSIIAAARAKRPKLIERSRSTEPEACPFCPGNEDMTPPAELIASLDDRRVVFETGERAAEARRWNVRVFPNMFPAFSREMSDRLTLAYGHHLIVVESPDHTRDFDQLTELEIETYLKAMSLEVARLKSDRHVNCVSAFKNYGDEAGASIQHPHTQIVASRLVPPHILEEARAYGKKWDRDKKSAISVLADEAEGDGRIILSRWGYVAFVPYAPMSPYEVWVAPTDHSSSFGDESSVRSLGKVLRSLVSAVKKMHGDIAYNLWFHLPPSRVKRFHWHIELVPRSNKFAGYELGFGAYIVTTLPEDAAQLYRQVL